MMLFFLLLWFTFIVLSVIVSKWKNLGSISFWLIVWWSLVIGVTLTTDAKWVHKPSKIAFGYFVLCVLLFGVGKKRGSIIQANKINTLSDIQLQQLHIYKCMAYIGLGMFVFDYYRLNGLAYTSRTYSISSIGALGNLIIPALLPIGLYEIGYGIKVQQKIRISGVISLLGYALPGLISHGRESIVFVMISTLSLVSMCLMQCEVRLRVPKKFIKYMVLCVVAVVAVVYFVIKKTEVRFTSNDISTFVYYHPLPEKNMREVNSWGIFSPLYYAIAWYFGTQFPYLEFILERYTGPYVLGAYEFNIISRRFPAAWGLNTEVVSSTQRLLFAKYGESFNALWPGFAGSLIFDFGKIGALLVIFVLGIIVGKITSKCSETHSLRYQVAVAQLCMMTFTTIQMGPLFQYNVWSTMLWWMIILGERRIHFVFDGKDI